MKDWLTIRWLIAFVAVIHYDVLYSTSMKCVMWNEPSECEAESSSVAVHVLRSTSMKCVVWNEPSECEAESSSVAVHILRSTSMKCVVWNEPSECEAESSSVAVHVLRSTGMKCVMWGREQWCGCTTSYTVLIVMSCKHGGLKWWSGVIQDWLLAAVVQVFVNCRFGGNRQHWTFLLEMLSLLPEEVRPHIVIVVVVVVVKSWWCGVIISGCHVLVSWCHIVM